MSDGYTAIFALIALISIVAFFLAKVSNALESPEEEGEAGKAGLFERFRRKDDFFVVDGTGKTILMQAVAQGFEEGVDHVLVKASVEAVNSATDDGTTALHCAIAPGNPAIVARLLDFGAQANAADHEGRTPLWLAAHKEDPRIAALLLDYKANPNCRVGKNRLTPLMAAAKNGRIEVVNLLLDRGRIPGLSRRTAKPRPGLPGKISRQTWWSRLRTIRNSPAWCCGLRPRRSPDRSGISHNLGSVGIFVTIVQRGNLSAKKLAPLVC